MYLLCVVVLRHTIVPTAWKKPFLVSAASCDQTRLQCRAPLPLFIEGSIIFIFIKPKTFQPTVIQVMGKKVPILSSRTTRGSQVAPCNLSLEIHSLFVSMCQTKAPSKRSSFRHLFPASSPTTGIHLCISLHATVGSIYRFVECWKVHERSPSPTPYLMQAKVAASLAGGYSASAWIPPMSESLFSTSKDARTQVATCPWNILRK